MAGIVDSHSEHDRIPPSGVSSQRLHATKRGTSEVVADLTRFPRWVNYVRSEKGRRETYVFAAWPGSVK